MSTPSPIQPPDPSFTGGTPPPPPDRPEASRGAVSTGILVAAIALALVIGGVLGWLVSQSSSDSGDNRTVTLQNDKTTTVTATGASTTDVSTETQTETVTAEPVTVTVTGATTAG